MNLPLILLFQLKAGNYTYLKNTNWKARRLYSLMSHFSTLKSLWLCEFSSYRDDSSFKMFFNISEYIARKISVSNFSSIFHNFWNYDIVTLYIIFQKKKRRRGSDRIFSNKCVQRWDQYFKNSFRLSLRKACFSITFSNCFFINETLVSGKWREPLHLPWNFLQETTKNDY